MHDGTTRGIVNKVVGSFRMLSPALKFTHGGYERTPLSLTNHTAKRCAQWYIIGKISWFRQKDDTIWLKIHQYDKVETF